MKVGVILLNYNSSDKFINIFPQLINNKNLNFILTLDNGSHINDLKQLKKIIPLYGKKISLIENKKNLGFASGVNTGIKILLQKQVSKIILINPDVKISSNEIDRLLSSSYDVLSPTLSFIRDNCLVEDYGGLINLLIGKTQHIEKIGNENIKKAETVRIKYVSGACMLIQAEVFKKIGLFDERFFMYFEDVDFCLRAKAAGFTVGVDLQTVVQHNISEHKFSNNTFKIKQQLKSNFLFIQKWVPWYSKPLAYAYFIALVAKTGYNLYLRPKPVS